MKTIVLVLVLASSTLLAVIVPRSSQSRQAAKPASESIEWSPEQKQVVAYLIAKVRMLCLLIGAFWIFAEVDCLFVTHLTAHQASAENINDVRNRLIRAVRRTLWLKRLTMLLVLFAWLV